MNIWARCYEKKNIFPIHSFKSGSKSFDNFQKHTSNENLSYMWRRANDLPKAPWSGFHSQTMQAIPFESLSLSTYRHVLYIFGEVSSIPVRSQKPKGILGKRSSVVNVHVYNMWCISLKSLTDSDVDFFKTYFQCTLTLKSLRKLVFWDFTSFQVIDMSPKCFILDLNYFSLFQELGMQITKV